MPSVGVHKERSVGARTDHCWGSLESDPHVRCGVGGIGLRDSVWQRRFCLWITSDSLVPEGSHGYGCVRRILYGWAYEWGGPWSYCAVGLMCEDEPPGSGLEKPEVCLSTVGRSPE